MHLLHESYFESFFPIPEEREKSREHRGLKQLAKSSRQRWVHSEHILYLSPKNTLGNISSQPFQQWYEERYVVITVLHTLTFKRTHWPKSLLTNKSHTSIQTQTVWSMFSTMKFYCPCWTKLLQPTSDLCDPWIFVGNFDVSELPRRCQLSRYKVTDEKDALVAWAPLRYADFTNYND